MLEVMDELPWHAFPEHTVRVKLTIGTPPQDIDTDGSFHSACYDRSNGQRGIAPDICTYRNGSNISKVEAKLDSDASRLRFREESFEDALVLELLECELSAAAQSHLLAWVGKCVDKSRSRKANTFQTRIECHWSYHTARPLALRRYLLHTPFPFTHVVSAPHDRVVIVDAKEHLALDGSRARDSSVKTLVDPLDGEQSLCWEILEYVLKDFSDVEDLVSRIAMWSVLFSSTFAGSVSVTVGALVFLALD